MRRQIACTVTIILITNLSITTGCRRETPSDSTIQSGTLLMVTTSVIQWLLEKALDVSVERKIDEVLETLSEDPDTLGDAESRFSKGLAAKLDVTLDQAFERDIKIKLRALQTSLTQDYIPGLGESATELALMNEKANDIRSAIDIYAEDKANIRHLGMALAHHRTYILASAIKLFVQSERLRMARASLGEKATPVLDLKKSIHTIATQTSEKLTKLETDVLYTYAKARLLSYDYKVIEERETFGFKQGLTYSYCIKSKNLSEKCGAPSKQICPNELSSDCITKAKKEAYNSFVKAEVEKPFMDAIRKDILDGSWDDVGKRLNKITQQSKNL